MPRMTWRYGLAGLAALLALAAIVTGVNAAQPPAPRPPLNILWGPAVNLSGSPGGGFGANEPAAALHPLNTLLALAGGNTYAPAPIHTNVERTTDQGLTWSRQPAANCSDSGDGVPVWLNPTTFGGLGALNISICSAPDGLDLTTSRTTDGGQTWRVLSTNLLNDGFYNDREYLWTDFNPASPYYGRTYVTEANLGAGGNVGYDSIAVRATTDGGVTWSPVNALVQSDEVALGTNFSEFPALAILPNGHVVAAWHRGQCCNVITNVPNKVMAARSTDGGVTFPFSTTIVTVPTNQSIMLNATSPGGFRWSDAPNITADPSDGTLYATWIAYQTPDVPGSAAAYVSRSTDEGGTWAAPLVADPADATAFQYMPWIKVTPDHTVHLTYSKQVGSPTQLGHFYVQSTDQGATWSTPFQLSATYAPTGFLGDYEAADLGGYAAGAGGIMTTWTQSQGSGATEDRWGRFGTFVLATPTPTVTGTPPTPTVTNTPTSTTTAVPSNTATMVPSNTATVVPSNTATVVPSNTATAVPSNTATAVPSNTATAVPSNTAVPPTPTPVLPTGTPPPTATPCALTFGDVHPPDYFYTPVQYLACHGAISGYADGTFRPFNNTTRAQMVKIVVLGFGKPILTPAGGADSFTDVPPANPFYGYVETAAAATIVGGYTCGGPGEPCDAQHRPYFRPYAAVTRGQLSKIAVVAAGWTLLNPASGTFEDVLPQTAFYPFVETAYAHGIISGYDCGGPGEPCRTPPRPYFRQFANATRGQIAKIVYLAVTAPAAAPSGPQ